MPSDYDNELLKQAILHFRSKEMSLAKRYLERALDIADDEDTRSMASFYMSELVTDPREKRALLENVLAYDRFNVRARRSLAILDGKLKPEDIVDADRLAPQKEGEVSTSSADRFTCPKCGGRMSFAPDGQSLTCEYCSRNQTLVSAADNEPVERDFMLAMATAKGHRKPVAIHSFACKGCGAAFILPPQVISATCSYCGSAHVVSVEETRELVEPDGVIPFAFTQKTAVQHVVEWARKKKVKPEGKVQLPLGMYLPVWTFDLGGLVPCSIHVMTNDRNDPIKIVKSTEAVYLNDIPVPATRKLGSLLVKTVQGFNYSAMVQYDPRFLADWPAEVYGITMSDASLDGRARAGELIKQRISASSTESGTVLKVTFSPATISIEGFKLTLIPVWLTSYNFEGKSYNILVNGQTGSVNGQTPVTNLFGWLDEILK
jgi:hypothetical protein